MQEFDSVQRVDLIKQICSRKRVLHLGCTNYPYTEDAIANEMLLHLDLEQIASDLTGLDADAEGIRILQQHGCSNVVLADLEHLEKCELRGTFDVIVAGEILEHLNNPGL